MVISASKHVADGFIVKLLQHSTQCNVSTHHIEKLIVVQMVKKLPKGDRGGVLPSSGHPDDGGRTHI
jgi:hypothetical protein